MTMIPTPFPDPVGGEKTVSVGSEMLRRNVPPAASPAGAGYSTSSGTASMRDGGASPSGHRVIVSTASAGPVGIATQCQAREARQVLHFTSRTEWERGLADGQYRPDAMAADGFVHLSFGHQLARVASERVPGVHDLVLLVVDPHGLEKDLRLEGGFPHLYRP